MSHTTNINRTIFNHNSDFSGDVDIITENGDAVEVPIDDIKGFVAEYIRHQMMLKLESMDWAEIIETGI